MSFLHRAYHVPGASPRADSKPQCWVILTRKPRKLTGALCLPAQPLVCLVAYFSLSLFSSFSSHRHKKRTLSMFSPRKWQSTPVLLPGKSHGQRNLVGYSPWGRKESDMTERLSLQAEGPGRARSVGWCQRNRVPWGAVGGLYSCLENPMDRGAWRVTVHGVAKRRTQLSNSTATAAVHSLHSFSGTLSTRSNPLNLFITSIA